MFLRAARVRARRRRRLAAAGAGSRGGSDRALNALLIGVTGFFRDEGAFAHLQDVAIPELLRNSPSPRMLCVGCSDGAEPYSLAITLLEAGGRDFSIRGIDCRRAGD